MFKNILVPLDESELSERAWTVAKDLAVQHGATIHLLEAVQPLAEVYTRHGMGPDSASPREYAEQAVRYAINVQIESGREYLTRLAEDGQTEGLNVKIEVREAAAPTLIQEYTADNNIDLIVMSTHGRGGIHRLLIGSVADRVIRSIGVPVLVITGGYSPITS